MCDAVSANHTRAVHAEDNRKVRNAHIMHDLVDRALQERRVDRDDGTPPARRKARRERDHVPLGDADVMKPPRKRSCESVKPRSVLHPRRQRHDPLVRPCRGDKRIAEGVRPRIRGSRGQGHLMRTDSMVSGRILLRRRIALPLLCDDMHNDTAFVFLRDREGILESFEIVSIHRADIAEPELLKVSVPEEAAFDTTLDSMVDATKERQFQLVSCTLCRGLHTVVADIRNETAEELRKGSGGTRDAHLVVIENDDQLLRRRREVVERLEARPIHECTVADDRHDMLVRPLRVPCRGESRRDRKRYARMARDRRVRGALRWIRKRRDAVHLPEGRKILPAAVRQDLPRIRLVPDVPYDAVLHRVKDLRKRHRDLHRPKGRRKMSAVLSNDVQNLLSDLLRCHLRFSIKSVVAFCPNASSRSTSL